MRLPILVWIILISINSSAQWPGADYGFELIGPDGEGIDSLSKDYKLYLDTATGPASISLCDDNKTLRLYKGDINLYMVSFLTIEKLSEGKVSEKMYIKFPPPLTGGKDKSFSSLYVGVIKFTAGTSEIKLPETPDDWDALKGRETCLGKYKSNIYLDISEYQKIK